MESLSVRLITNGVVYPTIRVASHPGKLLMGVYGEDDRYVDDTALNRRAGEQGAPVPRDLFPLVQDSQPPEAIYAGPLYFHFGHFLLESLARAWYAQQHPDVAFVWAGQHNWQGTKLRPWQVEILDLLGIANPTRIIADPTRFGLLHVPDIGYRYDDRFHPEHAEFLARYQGPAQVRGHRLWLSRSKIASDARDLTSERTERRLAEAGWTIAHPEFLGVREQLDRFSRAEVVAGEEGSAFHVLMLLKDVTSKKLQIFRRHGREHANMHTIGDARQVDQSFHSLEQELVLRAEGRFVSKVTPNSSEVLTVLGVPVPTAPDATPTTADAILGRTLAGLGPQRFLDVGAFSPHVVVQSTAPSRVAVSPRFDFDPRAYDAWGVEFYELGLELYADLFHEERDPFDVIRITGPGFEDVMASFRLSDRLAHPGTVWLLGSGDLAARVALAIRVTQPGFAVRRLLVQLTAVYVVERVPGAAGDEAGIAALSTEEVTRAVRWLPPTSLRRLEGRQAAT